MTEPPTPSDHERSVPSPRPAGGDGPAATMPYLLVMPAGAEDPPTIAWPGADGVPAWAIPVTVPAGTRGYAVFVPLVPGTTALGADTGAGSAAVAVVERKPAATAPAPPGTTARPVATASAVTPASADTPLPPASASPPGTTPASASPPGTAPAPAAGQPASQRVGPPGPAPYPFRPYPPRAEQPSFLATHWPGPGPSQARAIPVAVLAGALGLASFVPLTSTGIGWLLGWLTLTVAVAVAVTRTNVDLSRTDRWVRGGWAAAALALLTVLAFRNAWWLVTFCVVGALGCATLAIVGGRLVRSILFSLVAAPLAAVRGLPWVRGHTLAPAGPGVVRRIAGSLAATVAVLLVFGLLLSSADGAFSVLLGRIVPEINAGSVIRWLFLAAMGALIVTAALYTLSAPPDLDSLDTPGARRLGAVEWAPAIAALVLLLGGFVAVQFSVMFGGQRHVLKTAGLSYAEYARSGFWQLLTVTILTLAVLGGVARWARRERPIERHLLRILLGLLSALSVVIVGSALSRMYAYQKVYSFTGERLFVMAFELLLGAVFLMILAAGIRWRGTWIPQLTVGLAVVMLLSLAVVNPEDYAARRNIDRYRDTGKIDAWYLRALSADATPALAELPNAVRRCTLSWIADDLAESDPWYAWNLGRVRARRTLQRLGPDAVGGPRDCRAADQFDLPKARRPR